MCGRLVLCNIWDSRIDVDCSLIATLYYGRMLGIFDLIEFSVSKHLIRGCYAMYEKAAKCSIFSRFCLVEHF